jgi:hypothetical protein
VIKTWLEQIHYFFSKSYLNNLAATWEHVQEKRARVLQGMASGAIATSADDGNPSLKKRAREIVSPDQKLCTTQSFSELTGSIAKCKNKKCLQKHASLQNMTKEEAIQCINKYGSSNSRKKLLAAAETHFSSSWGAGKYPASYIKDVTHCNITKRMKVPDMVPSSSSSYFSIDDPSDRVTIKHSTANRMLTGLGIYFPWVSMQGRLDEIGNLIEESYMAADLDFKIERAIEWGDGFTFPPEVHVRDSAELAAMDYDLPALIRKRQEAMLPNRLNTERLRGRDPTDADVILLHDLVEGIRVPLDPDFVEDRTPGLLDKNYKLAHSAVDKSWYKLYLAGFILLFTTTAMSHIPERVRLNYSPAGWHKKLGSPGGRCIIDYSRPNSHGQALNTKRVKEIAKALYGEISPVQINRLMEMILEQVGRVGWENLVIWKMDLKGAFDLIFFRPDAAGLLTVPLGDGLMMVSLVGSFGHTVTPYAFDVISRTILADVKSGVKGGAEMCCDDVMGACAASERAHDMDWTRLVIEKLLGPAAVADDKKFLWTPTRLHWLVGGLGQHVIGHRPPQLPQDSIWLHLRPRTGSPTC